MSTSRKDDGSDIRFVEETTRHNIPLDLKDWLPTKHLARTIKGFVAEADFTEAYSQIKSRVSHKGRPVINPRTLAAVWLYAYRDGITSARELEQACQTDFTYIWLSGSTQPNYHTLSDFRTRYGTLIESLFLHLNRFLIE